MNDSVADKTKHALRLVAAFKEKHDDCFRRHGHSKETTAWMWQRYKTEDFAHLIRITRRILAERIADDADDLYAFRWN
jgi:hypothetical protein